MLTSAGAEVAVEILEERRGDAYVSSISQPPSPLGATRPRSPSKARPLDRTRARKSGGSISKSVTTPWLITR